MVRTEEELQSLVKFAESFDHNVGSDSIFPIYTISRDSYLFGYFNLICLPILVPAFHPDVCTPRDFYDAAYALKQHFCLNSISERFPNGTCLLALPKELAIKKEIVKRLGFKCSGKEIWQALP
jgi:hypothetical protein